MRNKRSPLFYREELRKLLLMAERNGVKVTSDSTKDSVHVYFEANDWISGVRVPKCGEE